MTTSYQPQGRGVSGLAFFHGAFYESTFVGAEAGNTTTPVTLATPEPEHPILIHKLDRLDVHRRELPALSLSGCAELKAPSCCRPSPMAPTCGSPAAAPPRVPTRRTTARCQARLLPCTTPNPSFSRLRSTPRCSGHEDRFVDIAPVPGTENAWVADQPYSSRGSATAKAKVALIGADGATTVDALPVSGPARGSAQVIAATGPEEAWMATSAGWLFHYTNGSVLPEDTDSNWASTITQRPNESIEQFVPDTPPADNSQLFAPPPVAVEQAKSLETPVPEVIPALLKDIKVSRRGLTVIVSFKLAGLAEVQLVAKRHGKTIAKTAKQRLKAGKHSLKLSFSAKRWPTGSELQDQGARQAQAGARDRM